MLMYAFERRRSSLPGGSTRRERAPASSTAVRSWAPHCCGAVSREPRRRYARHILGSALEPVCKPAAEQP